MPSKKSPAKPLPGPIMIIIGGVLGLVASFVLSYEALILAGNTGQALNCDLNSVISCSVVAQQPSATLLGFPNSFIGMMAFSVLITIGVVALSGVKLPKWFVSATLAGIIAGLLFAGWMFIESFAVIKVLCPWCLTTDMGMLIASYGVFRYAVRNSTSPQFIQNWKSFSDKGYDTLVLISILVLVAASILLSFGSNLFS